VPHLGFDNPVDWAAEAEPYRQKVQTMLEKELLPGMGAHLTASHVMTPVDFRDRYLSPHGCGFSIEPRILQSAWFRPHNVSEEIPGLYLTGAIKEQRRICGKQPLRTDIGTFTQTTINKVLFIKKDTIFCRL
jgi:phytoene dehydrogenase-like protein